MKRILLVDDDAFFRTMFSGLVNWESHGYSLLHAEDGRQAIATLHQTGDVVLLFTDMSMPILDGVNLIRYVHTAFPNIQCIALSAYDDFEYVKSSLTSGADDYLLKHTLSREQIIAILEKCDGVAGSIPQKEECKEQQARFLSDFVSGRYTDPQHLATLFQSVHLLPIDCNFFFGAVVATDHDGAIAFPHVSGSTLLHIRTLLGMIQNIIERVGNGVVYQNPDDHIVYFIVTASGFSDLHFSQQAATILSAQIEQSLLRYFNIKVSTFCSPLCRDIKDIRSAYLSLMHGAGLEPVQILSQSFVLLPPDDGALAEELRFGTAESLCKMLAHPFECGRSVQCTPTQFTKLTADLFGCCGKLCTELELQPSVMPEFPSVEEDAVQQRCVETLFVSLQIAAQEAERRLYSPIIFHALQIIHREFGNPQLSLQSISDTLHTNPAYLSRLFKAQTGRNLSDSINQCRIKHACRMLAQGKRSVKKISELCGFENYNYFFKVFKKLIGKTPKEFGQQTVFP